MSEYENLSREDLIKKLKAAKAMSANWKKQLAIYETQLDYYQSEWQDENGHWWRGCSAYEHASLAKARDGYILAWKKEREYNERLVEQMVTRELHVPPNPYMMKMPFTATSRDNEKV